MQTRPIARLPALALALGLAWCGSVAAQQDPLRYRIDPTYGTGGLVSVPLGSAVGQDFATPWIERNARLQRLGFNQTGWVFGGTIVFNNDVLLRLDQAIVSDLGATTTSARREVSGFYRMGGVTPAPDGAATTFLSRATVPGSLDSNVVQFRYNVGEFYTGCNGSFSFTDPISNSGGRRDDVLGVRPGPNGSTYAVGTTEIAGGEFRAFIARYQPDCTRDPSFGVGGVSIIDARRDIFQPARRVRFNNLRVDSAGRIVAVGGVMYSTGGISEGDCVIARFNANGSLDPTFEGDGIQLFRPAGALLGAAAVRAECTDVDFDAAGRIVVLLELEDASTPQPSDGRNRGSASPVRFNADGSLSSTFGQSFGFSRDGGMVGAGLVVLDNGDIVYAEQSLILSSPIRSAPTVYAMDPNVGNGIARWFDQTVFPNTGASRMSTDLLELPGSGFLVAGFSGPSRFVHTTAHLARYTFGQRYRIDVVAGGPGLGTVTGGGINCGTQPGGPSVCSTVLDEGQSITLTATPGPGSFFGSWSVAACGQNPTCTVQATANTTVNATFGTNTLTVLRQGAGFGNVTSSPAGIACGATCNANFDLNAVVTLTAAPAPGAVFAGWLNDASACGSNPVCAITMSGPRSAIALFEPAFHPLGVTLVGSGRVTSTPSRIDCPGACTAGFDTGSTVTLAASDPADRSFAFSAWSGDGAVCGGNRQCALSMAAARNVTATFLRRRVAVTVTATGGGTVGSTPAGITACTGTCSADFDAAAVLRLVATPGQGQVFVGWSGDAAVCGANPLCDLAPVDPLTLTATFGPRPDLVFRNGFEP